MPPAQPSPYTYPWQPLHGHSSVNREEFNSARLTNLETNFLLSQKNSYLESKLSKLEEKVEANFDLILPDDLDEVCHCGYQPATYNVKALSKDYGKTFQCCPVRDESLKCSFFRWKREEVILLIFSCIFNFFSLFQPEFMIQNCDCGKKSLVKTVKLNGPNYGRHYYCCEAKLCSFFQFVDPSIHTVSDF